MKERFIVFAPHPDDETLGCGGTIAKKVSLGYEGLVVWMTDGRNALRSTGVTSGPSPMELAEIRKKEAIEAANVLGLKQENLVFLGIEDGALQHEHGPAEEKVLELLNRIPPLEVYFPHNKDAHPDHRATNLIVNSSLRKLDCCSAKYRYIITYSCERLGPLVEMMLARLRRNTVELDISDFLPLKEMATRKYGSQLGIISPDQKKPVIEDRELKRVLRSPEVFYVDKREY